MFQLNKLADYATVIMAYMAAHAEKMFAARDLAEATHINLPTVSKILKLMTKANLLISIRGAKGGYELARPAKKINLAEIIFAIEERAAITECSHKKGECSLEPYCSIRYNWQLLSNTILKALASLSLADMSQPLKASQIPVTQEIFIDKIRTKS